MLSDGSAEGVPQSDREDSSRGSDIEDGSHSGGDVEDSSHSGGESGDREDSPAAALRRSSHSGDDREAAATLDKLLRDYGILKREQRKRQLHTTHRQDEIRKQEAEVDKLRQRQRYLRQSLAEAEGVQDVEHGERLAILLDMDEMDEATEHERRLQAELDREIAVQLRMWNKKEHTIAQQNNRASINRKEIHSLDYRLNVARTRVEERIAQNTRLRDEMAILRKMRGHFRSLNGRVEAELQAVRRELTELTDRTNGAYGGRGRAQIEVKALQRKEAQEAACERARQKEATEELAIERRRWAFVQTKNRYRNDPGDEERAWVAAGGDSIPTLEEVFLRVKAVLGEPDLRPDRVLWRFIRGEEMNAELTVFLGDQTDEAEELKTHRGQVESAIRAMTEEDAEATRRHLALMEETEARQLHLDEKLKNVEFMLRATAPTMRKFQRLNESILTTVARKEKIKMDEELGQKDGAKVTEENLLTYMGLVERKTGDLLTWEQDIIAWKAEEKEKAKSVPTY